MYGSNHNSNVTDVRYYRVTSLPTIGKDGDIYFIPNGQGSDLDQYIADKNGSLRFVGRIAGTNVGTIGAGGSSMALGNVSFADSNGVFFGLSNSVITASFSGAGLAAGMSSIGNTLGTSGLATNRLVLAGGSNVTLSQQTNPLGNTVFIHAQTGSQSVQTQNSVAVQGSTGNISFQNGNGITFGGNNSTITASHDGLTSQSNQAFGASNGSLTFQTLSFGASNGMEFYLTNGSLVGSYTTPTDYISTGQSSVFQQTNQMSNYLGTTYTSHTHSGYIPSSDSTLFRQTSADSQLQFTSQMTDYLGTVYTSHTHSQYVNTSATSAYQLIANSSLSLGTGYTTHTHSQYVNSSQSSLFQATSDNSLSLGTGYTTHTHSQYVNTSATSAYQLIANSSLSLGTGYTTHTHSQYLNTSQSSLFQATSDNSLSLGTAYTTHTHSQYLTTQTVQPVAASGSNGSFAYSTLSFGALNGFTFYTSNGSIVGSYTAAGGADGFNRLAAGTQTALSATTVVLSNSNGITFGMDGSSVITASHNGLTNAALFRATSNDSQLQFTSANTLFLGTAATQSFRHTSADSQLRFISADTQLQFTSQMSDYLDTGYTTHTHAYLGTAATQSFRHTSADTQLQFTSQMSDYLGTGYTTHTHTYAASNHSHGNPTLALTNLTGTTASASNGFTLSLSAANPGAGGGIAIANSQGTFTSGTAHLSAAGALTILSTTGQSFQFSVPGTSSLSATGAVSISTDGSTIFIGAPTGGAITLSGNLGNYLNMEHRTAGFEQSTPMFQPFDIYTPFQYDNFILPFFLSNATNSSGSATLNVSIGIYTRNASSISLLSSTSSAFNVTMSGTAGSYSLYGGKRLYPVGWTNTITAGNYWLGILPVSSTAGANMTWQHIVGSNQNTALSAVFGSVNNATRQHMLGLGSYSANTGALPNSVAFSQIQGSLANAISVFLHYFGTGTV